MTVARQYSTFKNEKLHRHNIAHSSNSRYTILYTIWHCSTIQYTWYPVRKNFS